MAESIKAELEHAKNKGLKSTFNVPNDLTVFADSNMLQFVLRNLISNAVKFTRNGGEINILIKANDNNSVEFSIKDSGIGMNSSMVEHLFRLDVQTNRKGTEGEPSSGLGLTLCKEFVEKLGGKIWVESEVGKGSVFYFTVPCCA
jgi:signal transduction histidine kinase